MQAAELPAPLPEIPRKRYFAIGEVSELCQVKAHVLRYWEQEFPQLKPVKRRGNRRYYQHDDVVMVRRIRSLLYEQGFTIGGARQRLKDQPRTAGSVPDDGAAADTVAATNTTAVAVDSRSREIRQVRDELESLLKLLR
ncbi:MerR family transcriptional regulator [Panacagrimonas sp.]|uniref:MerR family transcriptional regulator n=1 Tax=Panacagrimonas sp. TaxID=2480088 RepID=UPI003B52BAF0